MLARIIEPTSKLDALRVLEEAGVAAPSYATLKRRLPRYGKPLWRKDISAMCAAHAALGPASLVLYDVSTLYFETDQGDGFREPGFSKERRLEPQITIGLLTDAAGFPLAVEAFEGNKAETATMLPTLQAFMTAHRCPTSPSSPTPGCCQRTTNARSKRPGSGSSSATGSATSLTSSTNGARTTPAWTCRTGSP